MTIKKCNLLVTNAAMKEMQDHTKYCAIGLLSLEDGQKFDISVREENIYSKILPMTKIVADLDLTNSKYGMKLSIKDIIEFGATI